jgi:hypothetical protein
MSDSFIVTRRDFVRGTVGVVVGSSALGAASRLGTPDSELPGEAGVQAKRLPRSARVVVVRDEQVLNAAHDVDVAVLDRMLADTVMRLTGQKTPRAAWQSIFKPSDTVGLVDTPHLNPTHPQLVDAVR